MSIDVTFYLPWGIEHEIDHCPMGMMRANGSHSRWGEALAELYAQPTRTRMRVVSDDAVEPLYAAVMTVAEVLAIPAPPEPPDEPVLGAGVDVWYDDDEPYLLDIRPGRQPRSALAYLHTLPPDFSLAVLVSW